MNDAVLAAVAVLFLGVGLMLRRSPPRAAPVSDASESAYARTPRRETPTPVMHRLHGRRRVVRDVLLWLAGRVQGHPVWPSPFETLLALEDRADRIYVWIMPEATLKEATEIADQFNSKWVRKHNREPRATHIFTPNIEDVHHMTKAEYEAKVLPWLEAPHE